MKKFVLLTALFALFSQNIDAKSVSVDQAINSMLQTPR